MSENVNNMDEKEKESAKPLGNGSDTLATKQSDPRERNKANSVKPVEPLEGSEEGEVVKLEIDQEFRDLIPPLSAEEFRELKEDILAHGCLAPIITWRGAILDGNNRYLICKNNSIPFGTREMNFSNREEAKAFILTNQLARRNISLLTRYELTLMRDDIKNMKKDAYKRKLSNLKHGISDLPTVGESPNESINIQILLAKELGVSKGTVAKMQFLEKKFRDGEVDPGRMILLRSGEATVNELYNEIRKAETKGRATTGGRLSEHYEQAMKGIERFELTDILGSVKPEERNGLVAETWNARDNLTKIGVGLSNAKSHPEEVALLAAGKITVAEYQKLIQSREPGRSASSKKNARGEKEE